MTSFLEIEKPLHRAGALSISSETVSQTRQRVEQLAHFERCVARAFGEVHGIQLGAVSIFFGQVFFRQDGVYRALRYASATVDAGVWVDVIPGPFFFGLAGDNTFNRANFGAGAIADAQVENHMGHTIAS
jgi:hypothetical protein